MCDDFVKVSTHSNACVITMDESVHVFKFNVNEIIS